ncbi:hypothetical protein DHX103_03560 [Planococcus sp. X10-3]
MESSVRFRRLRRYRRERATYSLRPSA